MPITKYKLIFVTAHDFHDVLNRREALQNYRGSLNQDSTIHVIHVGCLGPSGGLVLDDRAYIRGTLSPPLLARHLILQKKEPNCQVNLKSIISFNYGH